MKFQQARANLFLGASLATLGSLTNISGGNAGAGSGLMLVNAAPVPLFFTIEQGQFRPFGIDTTGKDVAQAQAIRNILASDPTAKNAVKTAAKVEKAAENPKGPLAPPAPAPAAGPAAAPAPAPAPAFAINPISGTAAAQPLPIVELSDDDGSVERRWVKFGDDTAHAGQAMQYDPTGSNSQSKPFYSPDLQAQAAPQAPPRHAGYYSASQPPVLAPQSLKQFKKRSTPAEAGLPESTPFAQAGGVHLGSRQGQVVGYRPYH